jgi:hypothetical protein
MKKRREILIMRLIIDTQMHAKQSRGCSRATPPPAWQHNTAHKGSHRRRWPHPPSTSGRVISSLQLEPFTEPP